MIEIKNAVKTFGNLKALSSVECNIHNGSIFGVVGSNGAGKSTLLRVISGVYSLDEGSVSIDSKEIFNNPEAKKNIVFLSDTPPVTYGVTLAKLKKEYSSYYENFDFSEYKKLVKSFDLDENQQLNNMSKGMKRQSMIIIALCCNTKYIILDETLDGLDAVVRGLVKKKIYSKVLESKTTIIISSHSLRELEDFCDSLILIHKGNLIFQKQLLDMDTVLIKVQIALKDEFDKNTFSGIDIVKYSQNGSVANLIVKGVEEDIIKELNNLYPVLLETVPLTLEEIFTYELEERGYAIDEEYAETLSTGGDDDE